MRVTLRIGYKCGGIIRKEILQPKLKARAEVERRRRQVEMDNAAHGIQMWWHHTQGNFAAKLKARAEVERRRHEVKMDNAAHRIQMWWHHTQGNFCSQTKKQEQKLNDDDMKSKWITLRIGYKCGGIVCKEILPSEYAYGQKSN